MSSSEIRYAPAVRWRLAGWFGLYLLGSFWLGIYIPLFPMGLAAEVSLWFGLPFLPVGALLCVLAYAIYGFHMWLTVRAKTLGSFVILIVGFIILVFATFMACGLTDIFFFIR